MEYGWYKPFCEFDPGTALQEDKSLKLFDNFITPKKSFHFLHFPLYESYTYTGIHTRTYALLMNQT